MKKTVRRTVAAFLAAAFAACALLPGGARAVGATSETRPWAKNRPAALSPYLEDGGPAGKGSAMGKGAPAKGPKKTARPAARQRT